MVESVAKFESAAQAGDIVFVSVMVNTVVVPRMFYHVGVEGAALRPAVPRVLQEPVVLLNFVQDCWSPS